MNDLLLNVEVQKFITTTKYNHKLAFENSPFPGLKMNELQQQIISREKCEFKLPTWFNTPYIIFPEKLSIEQSSSELTASYKSSIVRGKSIIDLTGGFGVDAYFFSKHFDEVVHCEIQSELSEIVKHNFQTLKTNIKCFNLDGTVVLKKINKKFDCIYIDPSRRNESKGKVFKLEDYQPNVIELLDLYREFSNQILIKVSPLVDMSSAIIDLKYISEIHIIALNNEVKELLLKLGENLNSNPEIITVNFSNRQKEAFRFSFNEIQNNHLCETSEPLKFVYEPNAAIMKSGGFYRLTKEFNLKKLHKNSHLFTSDVEIKFPGRVFEIEKIVPYQKSILKENIKNIKANVTVRNFQESVETIKKKWDIKDGGNQYLFFTTDHNNHKIVLFCKKK